VYTKQQEIDSWRGDIHPYWRSNKAENYFLEDDKDSDKEPLYIGETLRMQINETLKIK